MNVADVVLGRAARDVLLVADGRRVTCAELTQAARTISDRLATSGVQAGDRVGIRFGDPTYLVSALLGALTIGAIVVPVHHRVPDHEAAAVFELTRVAATITARDMTRIGDTDPVAGDLATILTTSGSEGRPKGVALTHHNVMAAAEAAAAAYELAPCDRSISLVPLSHSYGFVSVLLPTLLAGGAAVTLDRFDPRQVANAWIGSDATHVFATPASYRTLCRRGLVPTGTRVRICVSAGAPLDGQDARAWRDAGLPPLRNSYGLTEASFVSISDTDGALQGAIGRPQAGTRLRICDEAGLLEVAAGEVGRVEVQGPSVMAGYWEDQAATAETVIDGWLNTGDLGWRRPDGTYALAGRAKEVVFVNGHTVYPAEVERVLRTHPGVAEAAVVGEPHPACGEIVTAFVVLQGNATAAQLTAHCRDHVARHKVPRRVTIVDRLPATPSGKLLKQRLAKGA